MVQVRVFEVNVWGDGDEGGVASDVDDAHGAVARSLLRGGGERRQEKFDDEEGGEVVGLPLGFVAVLG